MPSGRQQELAHVVVSSVLDILGAWPPWLLWSKPAGEGFCLPGFQINRYKFQVSNKTWSFWYTSSYVEVIVNNKGCDALKKIPFFESRVSERDWDIPAWSVTASNSDASDDQWYAVLSLPTEQEPYLLVLKNLGYSLGFMLCGLKTC